MSSRENRDYWEAKLWDVLTRFDLSAKNVFEKSGTTLGQKTFLVLLAGIGLTVLKVVYLGVEIYYNNALQLFATVQGISLSDLDTFHTFGKNMAAVGATLLIGGYAVKKAAKRESETGAKPNWLKLALVAAASYLGCLLLQTVLINSILVFSSNKTAYRAYAGGIAQTLVLSGIAESYDIWLHAELSPGETDDERRLLSMLPLVSTQSTEFTHLASNPQAVASALRVRAFYQHYLAAHRGYLVYRTRRNEIAQALYEAERDFMRPFRTAANYGTRVRKEMIENAWQKIGEYEKAMRQYRRSLFYASDAKIRKATEIFESRVGLPPNLSARELFNSEAFRKGSGLFSTNEHPTPPADLVEDGRRIANAVDEALPDFQKRLESELPGFVPDFVAGQTLDDFASLPAVMKMDRKALGITHPGEKGLDQETDFFQMVWAPKTEAEIQDSLDRFTIDSPSEFGRDDMSDIRDNALKAAYVMPIALCLSTVFTLLNAITLLPWQRIAAVKRAVAYPIGAVVLALVMSRSWPALHDSGLHPELPVIVDEIVKTSVILDFPGSLLTRALSPASIGLLPDSPCISQSDQIRDRTGMSDPDYQYANCKGLDVNKAYDERQRQLMLRRLGR